MAAAFQGNPEPLAAPPPLRHLLPQNGKKAFPRFFSPFTVNPGEGVLRQLMTSNSEPASLWERWQPRNEALTSAPLAFVLFFNLNIGGKEKKLGIYHWNGRKTHHYFQFMTNFMHFIHGVKSFANYQRGSFLYTLGNISHIPQVHNKIINVDLNNMAC